jgi:hypothetical protein
MRVGDALVNDYRGKPGCDYDDREKTDIEQRLENDAFEWMVMREHGAPPFLRR